MTGQISFITLYRNKASFHRQLGKVGSFFTVLPYLLFLLWGSVTSVRASNNASSSADITTVTFQYGASGYTGTVDTFLRGTTASNTNFNSDPGLEWDDNTGTTTDEIALIRFTNLFTSEGGPIPNGATITSATRDPPRDSQGTGCRQA